VFSKIPVIMVSLSSLSAKQTYNFTPVSSIEGALANFYIFSTNVNVARIRAARKLDRSLKTNFKLKEGKRKERASIETMSSINIVTGGRNLRQRFFFLFLNFVVT
jgi:hypothetical protein